MTSVIFMGTPEFSVTVLAGLLEANYDIQAVVTQPDKPVGRKKKLQAAPVKVFAQAHQLKIFQPEKLGGSSTADFIKSVQPDLIITAAFGQFLPTSVLRSAKVAAVNVHGSLLPKYRGGAPIQMAIMNGESTTGITIMYMAKKMDAGDILAQQAVPITEDETSDSLFKKMSLVGRDLLLATLPKVIANEVTARPQNEAEATFAYNLKPEQEILDFKQSAIQLDRQIRALNSDPVAYTYFKGMRTKIWFARPVEVSHSATPGSVLSKTKKQLVLATGDSKMGLAIEQLQPAGKNVMPISAYLNGAGQNIAVGDQLITEETSH
ncbi:methionyl-tRNA formyltransferase [Agrilactobacillus fermenti]|uniref:methionyl-tRNA formyltransferase n=1 Tax=Agrilactobacillus fermenti TaxID=2586909 RepID=UPI001E28D89C|nr:methionyl-tRNA formyltransferase [Agrilactobacillus fermenti]MCD2256220.1 methionyl-tRNA formyltransferase [Agrilactobacillus fermenti]